MGNGISVVPSLESSNENKRDMLTGLGDELKKVDKHRECKM